MVEFSLEEEALDEPPPLMADDELSLDNNSGTENPSLEEYLKKPELAEYYKKKDVEETSEIPAYELELLSLSELEIDPYQSSTYFSGQGEEGVYSPSSPQELEISYKTELDYFSYNQQYGIDMTPSIVAQTLCGITEEMSDNIQKSTVLFAREREEQQIAAENNIYFLITTKQFGNHQISANY